MQWPKDLLDYFEHTSILPPTHCACAPRSFPPCTLGSDVVTVVIKGEQQFPTNARKGTRHTMGPFPPTGSTAVVALIRSVVLVVGSVGDSRCVLSRDGRAVPLSACFGFCLVLILRLRPDVEWLCPLGGPMFHRPPYWSSEEVLLLVFSAFQKVLCRGCRLQLQYLMQAIRSFQLHMACCSKNNILLNKNNSLLPFLHM